MYVMYLLVLTFQCYSILAENKERIASLVVLPPLVLGYEELYDEVENSVKHTKSDTKNAVERKVGDIITIKDKVIKDEKHDRRHIPLEEYDELVNYSNDTEGANYTETVTIEAEKTETEVNEVEVNETEANEVEVNEVEVKEAEVNKSEVTEVDKIEKSNVKVEIKGRMLILSGGIVLAKNMIVCPRPNHIKVESRKGEKQDEAEVTVAEVNEAKITIKSNGNHMNVSGIIVLPQKLFDCLHVK